MGVKGLWEILEASGETVSVESLRGKILAVDVSIWIYQFIKSMRNDSGKLIKGSHIVGIIRRLCKLLYYGIRPLVVFDGGAPFRKQKELKRRAQARDRAFQKSSLLALRLFAESQLGTIHGGQSPGTLADVSSTDTAESNDSDWEEVVCEPWEMDDDFSIEERDLLHSLDIAQRLEVLRALPSLPELDNSSLASFSTSQVDRLQTEVRRKDIIKQFVEDVCEVRYVDYKTGDSLPKTTPPRPEALSPPTVGSPKLSGWEDLFENLGKRSVPHLNSVQPSRRPAAASLREAAGGVHDSLPAAVEEPSASPEPPALPEAAAAGFAPLESAFSASPEERPGGMDESLPAASLAALSTQRELAEIELEETSRPPLSPRAEAASSSSASDRGKETISDTPNSGEEGVVSPQPLKSSSTSSSISFTPHSPVVTPTLPTKSVSPVSTGASLSQTPIKSDAVPLFVVDAGSPFPLPDLSILIPESKALSGPSELPVAPSPVSENIQTIPDPLVSDLRPNQAEILFQLRKSRRDFASISDELIEDIKRILHLMGIPYIVSPEEAEAQCAALNDLGIVDGVITNDTDTFLFGGLTVYRNFFNNLREIELYSSSRIRSHLGLDRGDLIDLAQLLGCDYAPGVYGIGATTALSVISFFPTVDRLQCFKSWLLDDGREVPLPLGLFEEQYRTKKQGWFVDRSFPSRAVVDSFLHPNVIREVGTISWGELNMKELKFFCLEKTSWTADKVVEFFGPIAERISERRSDRQMTMEAFLAPRPAQPRKRPHKKLDTLFEAIKSRRED